MAIFQDGVSWHFPMGFFHSRRFKQVGFGRISRKEGQLACPSGSCGKGRHATFVESEGEGRVSSTFPLVALAKSIGVVGWFRQMRYIDDIY